MDPTTFDRIAKLFAARRLSRRQVLAHGGAGLAVGALAAAGLAATVEAQAAPAAMTRAPGAPTGGSSPAPDPGGFMVLEQSAPGATAVATPVAGAAKPITFLFLQSFERGSLVPVPGQAGHYTLTLTQDLGGETVYFSDRPQKIVGTVPTQQFLDGLGFTPDNPPNAALIAHRDATHEDIVVLELFNPKYDPSTQTLTYEVMLLQDWHKLDEQFQQTPDDEAHLPRDFTAAHLFIDDCGYLNVCYVSGLGGPGAAVGLVPGGPYELCWDAWHHQSPALPGCYPCQRTVTGAFKPYSYYDALCNAAYPRCNGQCSTSRCVLGTC